MIRSIGDTKVSDRLEIATALAAAFFIGARFDIAGRADTGLLVALVLLPVWASRATVGIKVIGVLGAAAIVTGLVLNGVLSVTHEISDTQSTGQIVLILQLVFGCAVLYWCRTVVGSVKMAFAFGAGGLAEALLSTPSFADNEWKFALSLPVSICILALAWGSSNRGRNEIIAMIVLIGISALNDTRSTAAIMGTVLLIHIGMLARTSARLRSTPVKVVFGLILVGGISYSTMQAFLLEGFLGDGAQVRSQQQIETGGSLLTGGRPEMGASIALIEARPSGYGIGTLPTADDIAVASRGMSSLNYDPDNGYVRNYMFGSGFEVHSVLGDLWIRFGIPGMLLLVALLSLVLFRALRAIAANEARALVTFITVQCVWEALFSPLWTTSIRVLTLGVALLAEPVLRTPQPRRSALE